ncbi:MAG: molybdate ABC transporter substrate-binding protein [Clostridiales bacterium]|jgi:molybdate transport system substrate-binding protein|nr:molybdate ABC transporter substrate-binding protein [Clostridiales bacterium]
MKRLIGIFAVLCILVSLLAGCTTSAPTPAATDPAVTPAATDAPAAPTALPEPDPDPVTILVAAAASLENSYVSSLIPMFTVQYPWITVEGTYDSSGKLQTQIEEGLAADVFMSAANKQMTALVDGGFIDPASVIKLLENEIVLIAPIDSDTAIASFEDVGQAETIAVGDPESVPAGQYASEALTSLGVWDGIQDKISLGTNVTEVLNWVAEGSADIGFVYATDAAQIPDKVKILASAPAGSLATKVIYPVGILAASEKQDAAQLFVSFLQSSEAIAVFEAAGFKSNI